METLAFPEGFKWGSAVWAAGVEGGYDLDGKTPAAFDEHFRLYPERHFNGVGPATT